MRLIHSFKQKQLKYLVNVAVLTTGFDAPHIDLIAILRPTESVTLYQQIVGRGLQLNARAKPTVWYWIMLVTVLIWSNLTLAN